MFAVSLLVRYWCLKHKCLPSAISLRRHPFHFGDNVRESQEKCGFTTNIFGLCLFYNQKIRGVVFRENLRVSVKEYRYRSIITAWWWTSIFGFLFPIFPQNLKNNLIRIPNSCFILRRMARRVFIAQYKTTVWHCQKVWYAKRKFKKFMMDHKKVEKVLVFTEFTIIFTKS